MIYNRIVATFTDWPRITLPEISYRYDVRQILVIEGIELPQYYEVDMCNEGDSTTVTMVGTEDGVAIPNAFLLNGRPIKAYVLLHGIDAGAVETRYEITIPVNNRPLRVDIDPTPAEEEQIDELIDTMNAAAEAAEGQALKAEGYAVGQQDGQDVEEGSPYFENNAKYYAEEAEAASQAVQDLSVSAQTGSAGSTASVQKTVDPETGAVSLAFTIPRGDTGNGIASIELLSTSGLNKTYRITMTDGNHFDFTVHDGRGISSCVLNQNYTLTINFDDGTSTTTTSIRGATGATPDFSIGTVTTGAAGTDASATITGTPEAPVLNLTIPRGNPGEVTEAELDDVKNTLNHKADVIYDTASGDIASFPDGADGLPVKDLTVAIEPVQDLHSYDSPWPAGGGKNKYKDTFDGWTNPYNYWIYPVQLEPGVWRLSASLRSGKTPVTEIVVGFAKNGDSYATFDSLKIAIKSTGETQNVSQFLITSEDSPVLAFYGTEATFSQVMDAYDVQLEYGSSPTSYAPYSNICPISGWTGCNISHSGADTSDPTVISISWQTEAGTVYGGTLDVTSGVLTVTMASVDLGTLSYNYGQIGTAGHSFFTSAVNNLTAKPLYKGFAISPIFVRNTIFPSSWEYPDNSFFIGNSAALPVLYIRCDAYTDATTFKTAMSGVQLVYELDTPQTYQLDPVTVTTLLGQNNIWADTGDSTVEYPADTKLFIEKLTQPTEDDMTANQNITSGKFFMVGNNLYFSTASITTGEQIVPGASGNCIALSLADALNNLNS